MLFNSLELAVLRMFLVPTYKYYKIHKVVFSITKLSPKSSCNGTLNTYPLLQLQTYITN